MTSTKCFANLRNSGYPPFYGDSDTQIFDAVKVGKFDFPSPEWDDISQLAKDFVIALLKKDPADR